MKATVRHSREAKTGQEPVRHACCEAGGRVEPSGVVNCDSRSVPFLPFPRMPPMRPARVDAYAGDHVIM